MIEAALDRTLIAPNTRHAEVTGRVEEALPTIGLPMAFDEFVAKLAENLKVPPAEVEEAFWGLIDAGKVSLSHDFQVMEP